MLKKKQKDILFVMKGKAFFRAKNIDDAFLELANHFANLYYNKKDEQFDIMIIGTDLEIKPYDHIKKN